MGLHHRRDVALVERDLERYRSRHKHLFPQFERTPEPSRGEIRLAAEVALATMNGHSVPARVRDRAMTVLASLARD